MKESELEEVKDLILKKEMMLQVMDRVGAKDVCVATGKYDAHKTTFHEMTTTVDLCRASYNVREQIKAMITIELHEALIKIEEKLIKLGLEIGK